MNTIFNVRFQSLQKSKQLSIKKGEILLQQKMALSLRWHDNELKTNEKVIFQLSWQFWQPIFRYFNNLISLAKGLYLPTKVTSYDNKTYFAFRAYLCQ
jgi:hypothetical protein